jgi:uncharacterized protein DUF4145
MSFLSWHGIEGISSKSYTCGHCGNSLASQNGWLGRNTISPNSIVAFIYVCHFCDKPTFFDADGRQWPGTTFGHSVNDIPEQSVQALYEEARQTTSVGAYTAAVLYCRKLLMHIAVSKGAPVGQNFITYVEYLADNHYIPPDAKDWVDHIRKKGNEANHEIAIMSKDDAEELLSFVEMLMKVIYEFPAVIKRKTATP